MTWYPNSKQSHPVLSQRNTIYSDTKGSVGYTRHTDGWMAVSDVRLHRGVLQVYTIFTFYAFTVWRTLSCRFRILRKQLWTEGEWKHVSLKEESNVVNLNRENKAMENCPWIFPIHLCCVLADSCTLQDMLGAYEPARVLGDKWRDRERDIPKKE